MEKYVVCSKNTPSKCLASLGNFGYSPLLLPAFPRLQDGVSAHADMLLFLYQNKYICTKEYRRIASVVFDKIEELGYEALITDEQVYADYPFDVLFNSVIVDKKLFCLENAISHTLKELAKNDGLQIINVRQGYTKCSVVKVSDNAIITADTGIAKSAEASRIDVLLVESGHVGLDGYDTGFIGGASGADKTCVYFCGDVMLHPDGKKIADFCNKHKKECVSLSKEPLFDVGSLFFLSKV